MYHTCDTIALRIILTFSHFSITAFFLRVPCCPIYAPVQVFCEQSLIILEKRIKPSVSPTIESTKA